MQTVESAHILAVASCLATETCRISTVLHRKLISRDYDIAIEVGDRDLCGRDHVELIFIDKIHLPFLVGELAGAVTGSFIDNIRGLYFKITGIGSPVEEELDESALEFRTLADVHRETRSGDLYTEIKVDEVVLPGKIPVRECVR